MEARTTKNTLPPIFSSFIFAAGCCAYLGCGGDSSSEPGMAGTSTGGAGEGADGSDGDEDTAGGAGEAPLYVIAAVDYTVDNFQTYLVTTPSLEGDVEIDYDNAVVLDYFANAIGTPGSGVIFTGSVESPEMTRWNVSEEGVLEREDVVSFAHYGVAMTRSYPGYNIIASDERAYFLDTAQSQLVIWNPAAMETVNAVDLGIGARDTLQPIYGEKMVLREDGALLIGVSWWNRDEYVFGDSVAVVEFDTNTDSIAAVHEDMRAGDIFSVSARLDGTVYYSNYSARPVARLAAGAPHGAAASLLRVVPPDARPQDAFLVDLSTLTDGKPAGEFLAVSENLAFMRVFYPEEAGDFSGDINEYASAEAYKWWTWDMASESAVPVEGQAFGVAGGVRYELDGRTFVTASSDEYSTFTLIELTADGNVAPRLELRGNPFGLLRVH